MTDNVLRIKEVATTRPLSPFDQFLEATTDQLISRAAEDRAVRNSWAKQGLLLSEIAAFLSQLQAREDVMNVLSVDEAAMLESLRVRALKAVHGA